MKKTEIENIGLPFTIDDWFETTRFHKEEGWKGIYTVDGFFVTYDNHHSKGYNNLSDLLRAEKASIEENMEQDLCKANYSYNEINVKIKETGGSIPIRDCINIEKTEDNKELFLLYRRKEILEEIIKQEKDNEG